MEKLNIIRKVDEPTEWLNSMVVVPKPNDEVRICLDPRDMNFAVKREHYQMPTLDTKPPASWPVRSILLFKMRQLAIGTFHYPKKLL